MFDLDVEEGVRLSGRVSQSGKPVPGATVSVWLRGDGQRDSDRAKTSTQGTYAIENLIEGEYEVSVEGKAGVVRQVTLSGDTVFDIDLPATRLAGRVLESGSSAPVVGAGVHVVGVSERPWVRVYEETDHFGDFDVTGFDPAEIPISVYKPGYECCASGLRFVDPSGRKRCRIHSERACRQHPFIRGSPLRSGHRGEMGRPAASPADDAPESRVALTEP